MELVACISGSLDKKNSGSINKPYFDFDEVIYVRILISDKEINQLYIKENKSEMEQKLFEVLAKPLINDDIEEVIIVKDLERINKTERTIDKKYFETLNNTIFIEKKCDDYAPAVCDPFYRDILLFKKNGILIGVAKFSFNGRVCDFAGTTANHECFGAFGEFDELRKILSD